MPAFWTKPSTPQLSGRTSYVDVPLERRVGPRLRPVRDVRPEEGLRGAHASRPRPQDHAGKLPAAPSPLLPGVRERAFTNCIDGQ